HRAALVSVAVWVLLDAALRLNLIDLAPVRNVPVSKKAEDAQWALATPHSKPQHIIGVMARDSERSTDQLLEWNYPSAVHYHAVLNSDLCLRYPTRRRWRMPLARHPRIHCDRVQLRDRNALSGSVRLYSRNLLRWRVEPANRSAHQNQCARSEYH